MTEFWHEVWSTAGPFVVFFTTMAIILSGFKIIQWLIGDRD